MWPPPPAQTGASSDEDGVTLRLVRVPPVSSPLVGALAVVLVGPRLLATLVRLLRPLIVSARRESDRLMGLEDNGNVREARGGPPTPLNTLGADDDASP